MGTVLTIVGRTAFWLFFIGFLLGAYLSNQLTGYATFTASRDLVQNKGSEFFLSKEYFDSYKHNLFFNKEDYK